jgi:hypothetical protein
MENEKIIDDILTQLDNLSTSQLRLINQNIKMKLKKKYRLTYNGETYDCSTFDEIGHILGISTSMAFHIYKGFRKSDQYKIERIRKK